MVLVECTEFASMYSRHCFRIMGTVGARFDADVHAVMSIVNKATSRKAKARHFQGQGHTATSWRWRNNLNEPLDPFPFGVAAEQKGGQG